MISLKKSNKGFTIVELLIVIVVIGILALLVITTYSGIQAKARNAKRTSDLKSLQTHIEAFFSQNGYYPSRANMNDGTWLSTNMKSLDQNALSDPSSPSSKTLASAPAAKVYSYQPTQSDGTTSCESDDTTCAKYTLTATYEGSVNGSTTDAVQNLD
jgi:prepilin-type N-terminal cleavage/methylation domain-containing protein